MRLKFSGPNVCSRYLLRRSKSRYLSPTTWVTDCEGEGVGTCGAWLLFISLRDWLEMSVDLLANTSER